MKTQLLDEIRDTNLSYLLLAQRLIRENKPEALLRLGVSEETADLIDGLSTAQILRISSSNLLICQLRFDDDSIWQLLCSHSTERSMPGLHAAILMARKLFDQVG